MMSCMALAAWSRPISSPYYTEHGQRRGTVLSDRITTVVMFRSGQLGQRCTIELNYSNMSARFADASVIRERTLETYEPSYVPGAARYFFIPITHSPLGVVGYVVAPELNSQGGRARSHETCGSTEAHLVMKARFRVKGYITASELTSTMRLRLKPQYIWRRRNLTLQRAVI
jgi:hypothetical protein